MNSQDALRYYSGMRFDKDKEVNIVAKTLAFGSEARQALREGIEALSGVVRLTLGPRGRNVLLEKDRGLPLVTNDGVTVAQDIEVHDAFRNVGVRILREVAARTNDVVGDGTTTAVVLAQKMVEEGMKALLSFHSPVFLKSGMEKAVDAVVRKLRERSVPVVEKRHVAQVASVASKDEFLGELVAEALERVGRDGVVTIEDSQGVETTLEVVEGLQFDRGFVSPYFVTDPEREEVLFEHPFILVSDYKIRNAATLLPLLERVFQTGRPLLCIVGEIDGEALALLVVNKLRGVLQVAAVKAPAFGERQKEILGDIAVLTGGQVILQDLGMKLEKVTLELLGQAEKVRVTRDATVIVGGKGKKRDIEERIRQIRAQIEKATSDDDREKLEERLGRLTRGVAVIRVGAPTEVELQEKRLRVEDALAAARAALEEGIVPGGGAALLHLAQELDMEAIPERERTGAEIVRRALEEPARQIAENAGYQGSLIAGRMKAEPWNVGFDVVRGDFVDMFAAGIVDPAKVVRVALQNALSVASLVVTTEVIIAEETEIEKR